MPDFIINKNSQDNGDHEVHNMSRQCSHLPLAINQIRLGNFSTCHEAIAHAKRLYPSNARNINGCYWCAKECHTS